jgi:hypothetical protein
LWREANIVLDGWRNANIMLDGWHDANIAFDGWHETQFCAWRQRDAWIAWWRSDASIFHLMAGAMPGFYTWWRFYFYEKLRWMALGFDNEDAAEMTKRITLPK